MKRDELIAKTMKECRAPVSYKLNTSRPELERRLPQAEILTCADFVDLKGECCETCHRMYPHYEMHVIEFLDGKFGWICCRVRSVLQVEVPFKLTDY
jgi:hypothetical protein